MSDAEVWIEKDGELFFKSIGVKSSDFILDFGSGEGHYAIPAAKVAGEKGKVYAFDKDKNALDKLKEAIGQFGLGNIELLNGDTKIPLEANYIDIALCFDVIHYEKNRANIYREIYRVLKPEGVFSVYPKHYKKDFPLMELAGMELDDVKNEIEECGFYLQDEFFKKLLHDGYYTEGYVLNLRKRF